ncbi:hypothetical protein BO94DRAFT_333655 [Aspergillus sclerotioniger CBS 115572]|uniref:Uncharacterized protein n=1 Tax=Aspergillus sclerotioniger CBS 115572 TaxID=1450535 RepID=A0A317UVP5_9EURO|nr:hypothetical protein BO94DRAFT_333655 [Aspergillus sclerotioniger CBS 115572]PWY66143.1 hypothetical protein BO94DRAFT_333655 [Aspergillus sclerotioniger CBS 115572]
MCGDWKDFFARTARGTRGRLVMAVSIGTPYRPLPLRRHLTGRNHRNASLQLTTSLPNMVVTFHGRRMYFTRLMAFKSLRQGLPLYLLLTYLHSTGPGIGLDTRSWPADGLRPPTAQGIVKRLKFVQLHRPMRSHGAGNFPSRTNLVLLS